MVVVFICKSIKIDGISELVKFVHAWTSQKVICGIFKAIFPFFGIG